MFCDSLSAMGSLVGHFTLKNAELRCNLPLHGSPPPPSFPPMQGKQKLHRRSEAMIPSTCIFSFTPYEKAIHLEVVPFYLGVKKKESGNQRQSTFTTLMAIYEDYPST